jgi:hypothetical protein
MKIETYISHGPLAGPRAWVGVDIGKLSHHFLPRSFQAGRQIARQPQELTTGASFFFLAPVGKEFVTANPHQPVAKDMLQVIEDRPCCLSGVRVLQDSAKAVREVVWESVILKDVSGARYSAL